MPVFVHRPVTLVVVRPALASVGLIPGHWAPISPVTCQLGPLVRCRRDRCGRPSRRSPTGLGCSGYRWERQTLSEFASALAVPGRCWPGRRVRETAGLSSRSRHVGPRRRGPPGLPLRSAIRPPLIRRRSTGLRDLAHGADLAATADRWLPAGWRPRVPSRPAAPIPPLLPSTARPRFRRCGGPTPEQRRCLRSPRRPGSAARDGVPAASVFGHPLGWTSSARSRSGDSGARTAVPCVPARRLVDRWPTGRATWLPAAPGFRRKSGGGALGDRTGRTTSDHVPGIRAAWPHMGRLSRA